MMSFPFPITDSKYYYLIRPNMLDEIPYRVYGPDNCVHYSATIGDSVMDVSGATGYYITHGGPNCKRRIDIKRKDNDTYEGIAYCLIRK